MTFSAEQAAQFRTESSTILRDLQHLALRGMAEAQGQIDEKASLYLNQGVGRRVAVLQKALRDTFQLFPPERVEPLSRDDLAAVQVNLHAFVINLAGIFDNWAWAFVYRHNLLRQVGGRLHVGMFKAATQDVLPVALREYLQGEAAQWYEEYVKTYRDTLAHRIPLYIPPAALTQQDEAEYQRLEGEKARLFGESQWDELDVVWGQQDIIGRACPMFLHEAIVGGDTRYVYLHPQMLCDGMTVVEFGRRFYDQWHQRAGP